MRRTLIFLAITFGITYAYDFAVVYPIAQGAAPYGSEFLSPQLAYVAAVALTMFFPALGVVLTRLVTREGFRNCVLKPRPWRQSLPWFAVAWFGPLLFVIAGAAVYFLVFPGDFDPGMTAFFAAQREAAAASGVGTEALASLDALAANPALFALILLGQCAIAPALNLLPAFGEEWGWRGYLVPKVAARLSVVPTMLITGVIWGLWHAPAVALGHNYGMGYAGEPWTGIAMMCLWCIVLSIFLSYVTFRTGSTFAAAIGHGAVNGATNGAVLFSLTGGNPFVGPLCTGFVGGAPLLVLAALLLWDMRRREKAGTLRIPEAGLPDGVRKGSAS